MRVLAGWLLCVFLMLPAPRGSAAAPPDEGVSAAAAASTPDEASSQAAPDETTDQDLEARLTDVQGPVYVHLADHAEDDYIAAEKGMPVAAGDEIRVGEGGYAELTVDGDSVVELSERTDFVVNSLAPEDTEFHLGLGSLVAKIKHLLDGRRMEFQTPTAVAAVRGTELGVEQDEGQEARVGVFDEGNVAVTGADGEGEVHLGPNQEASIARGKPIAAPARLAWWKNARARMARARGRQGFILAHWRARPLAERRQWRARLLRRPMFKRAALKGLSPLQRARGYGALRARQQALRQRRRQLRQQAPRQRRQMLQQRQQRLQQRRRQLRQEPRRRRTQGPSTRPKRWQARGGEQRRPSRRFLARGGRRR